jgi:hypothetical protein
MLKAISRASFQRSSPTHFGTPAEAAADIFFLADLEMILERFGNRGYHEVQLEAGIAFTWTINAAGSILFAGSAKGATRSGRSMDDSVC